MKSQEVWWAALRIHQLHCRPLGVDEPLILTNFSMQNLREVLFRSHHLYTNWGSENPTQVASPLLINMAWSRHGDMDVQECAGLPILFCGNFMYMVVLCKNKGVAYIEAIKGARIDTCEPWKTAHTFRVVFPSSESSSLYVVSTGRHSPDSDVIRFVFRCCSPS